MTRVIVIALDAEDAERFRSEAAQSGYEIVAVLTPDSPDLDRSVSADAVLGTGRVDLHGTHKALHRVAVSRVTANQ